MKKTIVYVASSAAISLLLVIALFLSIVAVPKDVFYDTYNNVLTTKYETLMNTDSPKIIIITGSSAAFSLDGSLLSRETGMNVANMALHAGIGALYETELSKANIQEGDIVLLAYEWGWATDENYTDTLGTNILMQGIDENIEMYRYLPVRKYKDVLGYLFTFANAKRSYAGGASGPYSRSAFSENGNTMTLRHDGSPIVDTYSAESNGYVDLADSTISDSTVDYLKAYKEYVEEKGASVYWIGCPTYREAVNYDVDAFTKIVQQEEEKIEIDFISDPIDYLFPGEFMYDTIYHTNTLGMEYRTELLADDLKKAEVVENKERTVLEAGDRYEFDYVGAPSGFMALEDGAYKIEAWGAGAASSDDMIAGSCGKGAYTSGTLKLQKGDILYVYVGGQSGWNGDGADEITGGDATDIRLSVGEPLDPESLKSRIMAAGGGKYYDEGAEIDMESSGNGDSGLSFIAGYEGYDARSGENSVDNIIHTGQPGHYSSIVFEDMEIIDGSSKMPSTSGEGEMVGNAGNGKAVITYLGKI